MRRYGLCCPREGDLRREVPIRNWMRCQCDSIRKKLGRSRHWSRSVLRDSVSPRPCFGSEASLRFLTQWVSFPQSPFACTYAIGYVAHRPSRTPLKASLAFHCCSKYKAACAVASLEHWSDSLSKSTQATKISPLSIVDATDQLRRLWWNDSNSRLDSQTRSRIFWPDIKEDATFFSVIDKERRVDRLANDRWWTFDLRRAKGNSRELDFGLIEIRVANELEPSIERSLSSQDGRCLAMCLPE